MKKITLSIFFFLSIVPAWAQFEQVTTNDPNSNTQLNDTLQQVNLKLGSISAFNATTNSFFNSNILSSAHGGTSANLSNAAANTIPYFSLTGIMGNVGIGTTGAFLAWGNPPSYIAPPPVTSNALFLYSASVDFQGTGGNGEISAATFLGSPTTNYRYMGVHTSNATTVSSSKFKKIAGISTVTVYGQIWENGASAATLKVIIGSVSGSVTDAGGVNLPAWNNFSIDVSSLTNGTVYDVSIQMSVVGGIGYLGNLIAFGS